jgi:hypothetical protein
MARGGHGLPNVSLGPAMPHPSKPCRWQPLKQPFGHFRSGRPQDRRPMAVFYPLEHSTPYASVSVNIKKRKSVREAMNFDKLIISKTTLHDLLASSVIQF